MAKSPPSSKFHKEEVKAPLRFFRHVKLEKQQKLEVVLEEESLKPHHSNAKGYSVKVFKDHVELVADKNAKKLPVKKIKFSQVERVIPNEKTLCVYIGCRQGRNATVTSIGFTEESVYVTLMNYLTSGLVVESKDPINQPVKTSTESSLEALENTKAYDTPTFKRELAGTENMPINNGADDTYATSYIIWDERKSDSPTDPAVQHVPVLGAPNTSTSHTSEAEVENQEEIKTEIRHCPCCLQHSGINLKLSSHGHKGYAPSSIDGRTNSEFPALLPHKYRCYRPRPLKPSKTENVFSDFDDSDSNEFYPPKQRHRSQPPPTMFAEKVDGSLLPRAIYQLPQYSPKVKPRSSRCSHHTRTSESSPSSGYTSATIREDGLKLTVDLSTSGQYIRNKRRLVTGRLHSETRKPRVYYYRKNDSGLHRFQHLRT